MRFRGRAASSDACWGDLEGPSPRAVAKGLLDVFSVKCVWRLWVKCRDAKRPIPTSKALGQFSPYPAVSSERLRLLLGGLFGMHVICQRKSTVQKGTPECESTPASRASEGSP